MRQRPSLRRFRFVRAAALVSAAAAVAAACGGGGGGGSGSSKAGDNSTPRAGGKIVYALDAETGGGWCPKNAQLAASGIIVNDAIYEQLVVPDNKGGVVPYLAESVTPSADYRAWTIKVRPGIKFHNGELLDAAAVKLNIDTVKSGPLGSFVLRDITATTVVDPLTVRVDMQRPWVAYPWVLFGTGRGAMAAPEQLKSRDCASKLIGTGPFMLKGQWIPNDHLTVVRNPTYWRKDSAGRQLPYLDEIEFRPIIDPVARLNALKANQVQMLLTDNSDIIYQIRQAVKAGQLTSLENLRSAEVSYSMLRVDKAPFNDFVARQAVRYAGDRNELNEIVYHNIAVETNTPFAPDVFGYVKEPIQPPPQPDLNRAKQLVQQYKDAHGGKFEFTLSSTNDPSVLKQAQVVASQWERAGMTVHLRSADQATLINQALGGDFQATVWRNHPGSDPDTQYVWWHTGSPVNFGNFKDPVIDEALDTARVSTDVNVRRAAYERIQRRFGEQLYNLWGFYSRWTFATQPKVHGVTGPDLPTGGKQGLIASVHPLVGLYLSK
jgi:peptide/nickel transport system substrate-binding protein